MVALWNVLNFYGTLSGTVQGCHVPSGSPSPRPLTLPLTVHGDGGGDGGLRGATVLKAQWTAGLPNVTQLKQHPVGPTLDLLFLPLGLQAQFEVLQARGRAVHQQGLAPRQEGFFGMDGYLSITRLWNKTGRREEAGLSE